MSGLQATLTTVLAALEGTPAAAALRGPGLLYPLVNAAHILAIGLLVGPILLLDLRLLGLFGRLPLAPLARYLSAGSAAGLVLAVMTGILLLSVRPFHYVENPPFLAKMTLLAIGTIVAVSLRWTWDWRGVLDGAPPGPRVRGAAAISLVLWPSAIVAGRMIAFVGE